MMYARKLIENETKQNENEKNSSDYLFRLYFFRSLSKYVYSDFIEDLSDATKIIRQRYLLLLLN